MPRRIDIELTSARDDGTWNWRAAGAREPKGTVPGAVLPAGAEVGDVLKVDAEFFVDGIEITSVVPAGRDRKEPTRLELLGTGREDPPVTTTVAPRRDERGDRPGRGPRRGGESRDRGRRGRERDGEEAGRGSERRERGDDRPARRERGDDRPAPRERRDDRPARRDRRDDRPAPRERPEPPPMPAVERPKAKRLRPAKAHRSALLASLPEEQRPVAEQLLLGGLPAVRQAIEKQNEQRKAAGEAPIAPGPLVDLAEKLAPRVRAAEWRDRAEAAQEGLERLDLRDLRSVVSAAGDAGKDSEARALAESLKEGLAARVDAEHARWLEELTATLDVGRVVRALRLSSRPPKAGAPLPADLSNRLVAAAGEAMTADASAERWVAVLDALAFSPVRDKVIPSSLPKELDGDVRATIARLATRIPKVAHIFEVEADSTAARPKLERRRPPKPKGAPPTRTGERRSTRASRTSRSASTEPAAGPAPAPAEPTVDLAPAQSEPEPTVDLAPALAEPTVDLAPAQSEPGPDVAPALAEPGADLAPAPAEPAAGPAPAPAEPTVDLAPAQSEPGPDVAPALAEPGADLAPEQARAAADPPPEVVESAAVAGTEAAAAAGDDAGAEERGSPG